MTELDISEDFIEESKANLGQFKPKLRKTGPYSKHDKDARRNEAYRLYFEYGYTGRQIAKMMKINRNTVHSDIQFWYNQITSNFNEIDPTLAIVRQITKLENQKTRLRVKLDKTNNFTENLAIEKLLFEIDCKIIHIRLRMRDSEVTVHEKATRWLNEWMEKNGQKQRHLTIFDTIKVSPKACEQINKIIKDDKNRGIF